MSTADRDWRNIRVYAALYANMYALQQCNSLIYNSAPDFATEHREPCVSVLCTQMAQQSSLISRQWMTANVIAHMNGSMWVCVWVELTCQLQETHSYINAAKGEHLNGKNHNRASIAKYRMWRLHRYTCVHNGSARNDNDNSFGHYHSVHKHLWITVAHPSACCFHLSNLILIESNNIAASPHRVPIR